MSSFLKQTTGKREAEGGEGGRSPESRWRAGWGGIPLPLAAKWVTGGRSLHLSDGPLETGHGWPV